MSRDRISKRRWIGLGEPPARRCRVAAVVAAIGLALAACGTDEPDATEPDLRGSEGEPAAEADGDPSTSEEDGEPSATEEDAAEEPAGEDPDGEHAVGEDPVGEEAAAEEPADVPEALAFTAPAVGGGEVDGADLAGRPVALWFWAPWCPTCNREAPEAAQLADEYGDAVRFVGIAGLDDITEMEGFVSEHDVGHFPHAASEDGELWVRFGVSSQPAWIILDAAGEEVLSGIRPSLDSVRAALDEVSEGS